jgi:hypothetical protein
LIEPVEQRPKAVQSGICFSTFGIEDAADDFVFTKSFGVLNEIEHLIKEYQGIKRCLGF